MTQYYGHRCIAVLDILGFSRRIGDTKRVLREIRSYSQTISATKKVAFRHVSSSGLDKYCSPNVATVEFVFDTLVVVSKPLSESGSVGTFLGAISAAMTYFALRNLPLRGAIGIGDYAKDEESGIFISDVFKVLSNYEKSQNWAGCIVTPACASFILGRVHQGISQTLTKESTLLLYDVPTKEDTTQRYWCLNWVRNLSGKHKESLIKFMNGDVKKQAGTLKFFEWFSKLPDSTMFALPNEFFPAKLVCVTSRP